VAIVVVLALAVVGFVVFHKSDEQLIEDRIQTLQDAYNEGDASKLISCFDHKTQIELKAIGGIASSVLGVSISDLFGAAAGLSSNLSSFTGDDVAVVISIHSIRIRTKTAQVDVTFAIGAESQDTTLPMVKSGFSWYINLSG